MDRSLEKIIMSNGQSCDAATIDSLFQSHPTKNPLALGLAMIFLKQVSCFYQANPRKSFKIKRMLKKRNNQSLEIHA